MAVPSPACVAEALEHPLDCAAVQSALRFARTLVPGEHATRVDEFAMAAALAMDEQERREKGKS